MAKKDKKLTLKDAESVASLFVGDLIRYYKAGGDMKNLTAKKVYSLLRKTDEKAFDHDELLAEIETVKDALKDYPYLDDGEESRELVELILDIDLTEEDENFLMEKLNLSGDGDWADGQVSEYIKEALKLRGIREEDSYRYIKAVYHNTDRRRKRQGRSERKPSARLFVCGCTLPATNGNRTVAVFSWRISDLNGCEKQKVLCDILPHPGDKRSEEDPSFSATCSGQ